MEATREERQQMRQRGAGTRKAKEVNFGFSFGSPVPQISAPAPLAVPEPQKPSQTQPAPNTTPQHLKQSQSESQARELTRTPGSARNKLPPRRSTYDLPSSDDRLEHTRSNKRRKISPTKGTEDTPSRRNRGRIGNGESLTDHNKTSRTEPQTSHVQEPLETDAHIPPKRPSNEAPQPPISPVPGSSIDDPHAAEDAHGAEPATSAGAKQTAQVAPSVSSSSAATVTREQGSASSSVKTQAENVQPSPPPPEERTQTQNTEEAATTSTPEVAQPDTSITGPSVEHGNSDEAVKATGVPMPEDSSQSSDNAPEPSLQESQVPRTKAKTPRDLPAHNPTERISPEPSEGDAVQVSAAETHEPEAVQAETSSNVKRPRGRPSLNNKKATEAVENEEISPEPRPDNAESLGSRRGRKPASQQVNEQPQSVVDSAVPKAQRGRPAKKAKQAAEPEPEPAFAPTAQPDPVVESAPPKAQRGRPSKKNKHTTEPDPDPEPVTAEQADLETEPAAQVSQNRVRRGEKLKRTLEPTTSVRTEDQTESESPAVPQIRQGRPSKKATRTVVPDPEPEPAIEDRPPQGLESAASKPKRGRTKTKDKRTMASEPETEAEVEPGRAPETEYQPEAETTQDQPRRQTREPRGETVPITVYRLANVTSLGGTGPADDRAADEEESSDELTSQQKTKVPNRGGVNPADVLSQICRETLEKTLNTLKDGIANEANATRRAEWSRKRKAVEAFGSELESRLMDLSGMLDSNFVLGMQLKKTKREMMDLRNHLYRVRRERENIALQMDAVRSKHMEEEKVKSSRNTINNALHSLELALDRNQQRSASSADSSPDLEFMLRTVADVSSRAPGSQGGLLNQIRAFNAQLEATAARLER